MTDMDRLLARLALTMGPKGARVGDDNVRLDQEPENGLELRMTILDGDGHPSSVASVFLPRDQPPPSFPPDLPFLRHATIHVIEDRDRDVLLGSWQIGARADLEMDAALERLVARSREAGWTLDERTGRTARLSKGPRRRRIQAGRADGQGGGVLSVADGPADEPDGASGQPETFPADQADGNASDLSS
jgi:hypothetical protein